MAVDFVYQMKKLYKSGVTANKNAVVVFCAIVYAYASGVPISMECLMRYCKIRNKATFLEARQQLVDAGLISFSAKKGAGNKTLYQLLDEHHQCIENPSETVSTSLFDDLPVSEEKMQQKQNTDERTVSPDADKPAKKPIKNVPPKSKILSVGKHGLIPLNERTYNRMVNKYGIDVVNAAIDKMDDWMVKRCITNMKASSAKNALEGKFIPPLIGSVVSVSKGYKSWEDAFAEINEGLHKVYRQGMWSTPEIDKLVKHYGFTRLQQVTEYEFKRLVPEMERTYVDICNGTFNG